MLMTRCVQRAGTSYLLRIKFTYIRYIRVRACVSLLIRVLLELVLELIFFSFLSKGLIPDSW